MVLVDDDEPPTLRRPIPHAPPSGFRRRPLDEGDGAIDIVQLEEGPYDLPTILAALPAEARAELTELDQLSRVYEEAVTALNTKKVYESRFRRYSAWCRKHNLRAVPAHPEVIRCYLVDLAREGKSLSTIEVTYAAINGAHRVLSHPPPASDRLRVALRGLRRRLGSLASQAMPIDLVTLKRIVGACKDDWLAVRDKALLLTTYFGGFHRSESAGIERDRIDRQESGFLIYLRKTKSDQEGRSKTPIGLVFQDDPELCPVRALDAWLLERAEYAVHAARGPLFFSLRLRRKRINIPGLQLRGFDVDRILKQRAEKAGLDPSRYSAHGLRAGVFTEAARKGVQITEIQKLARHTDINQTARYVRAAATLSTQNPTHGLTSGRTR
jgi:site-specific recombinase XerD